MNRSVNCRHSDDLFCDEDVISDVINKMKETETELFFSDLVIVDAVSGKLIRYYMADYFRRYANFSYF